MIRFRRGMTILQRQKLRAELFQKEVAAAHRRAGEAYVTIACRRAMSLTGSDPAQARELHAGCKGEELPTGRGCLCLCHDVITGEVVAGNMAVQP